MKKKNIKKNGGNIIKMGSHSEIGQSYGTRNIIEWNMGQSHGKWYSLFQINPSGKSIFLNITIISKLSKGVYNISISDSLIDHSVKGVALILVGILFGYWPHIDMVRSFIKRKWYLKVWVEVVARMKGFFSFEFSNEKDFSNILCGGL